MSSSSTLHFYLDFNLRRQIRETMRKRIACEPEQVMESHMRIMGFESMKSERMPGKVTSPRVAERTIPEPIVLDTIM